MIDLGNGRTVGGVVGLLDGFLSTWSNARKTFGRGTPQTGEAFDQSSQFSRMQTTVQSAAPGDRWSGTAAAAYGKANADHGKVFDELAALDRRLAATVSQSAQVVAAGREKLDGVKSWVVDAASSLPPGKDRERLLVPIVKNGLGQITDIMTASNTELNRLGGEVRKIGAGYQLLGNQKFAPASGPSPDVQFAGGADPYSPGVEKEVERGPLTPGRPADPSDPFVGNPNFGQWETVSTSPTGPYPPVTPEYRPFPEGTPLKVGPTTGLYVPGQTWVADEDAPIVQYREGYRFQIAGQQATDITRVVTVNGETQVQRWVGNVYEYQRNTSTSAGGDFSGLPPVQNIDNTWKPISLPEIANLSAKNGGVTYYLPDGCGGTVNFVDGAPVAQGLPPTPPIMTVPR